VVWNDRLYTINRAGVLLSASVQTGEIVWQLRLQGPFSGSPVVAANRLYACNENGQTTVVGLGDASGEVLAENKLTDTVLCTPALSDNFIFVRSDQRLYCIGAN
jgi:outer membrane protein assembly factor BamB